MRSMEAKGPNETFVLKTTEGDITIELFNKEKPVTANNFSKLARSGFYDGVKFHRVIDEFIIQAGDPLTKDDSQIELWGTGGPGYEIEDELNAPNQNLKGTLAMANAGPNTAGSQFFINLEDNLPLDTGYSVFGRVVSGMEVVGKISKQKVNVLNNHRPDNPVIIEKVEFLGQ